MHRYNNHRPSLNIYMYIHIGTFKTSLIILVYRLIYIKFDIFTISTILMAVNNLSAVQQFQRQHKIELLHSSVWPNR